MKKLIDKLLQGETIELKKILTNHFPNENEKIWAYTTAEVLEGKFHKVIEVTLSWSAQKINNPKKEVIYGGESMYRLPYTEDKELLEKIFKLIKNQSHSYNANRI